MPGTSLRSPRTSNGLHDPLTPTPSPPAPRNPSARLVAPTTSPRSHRQQMHTSPVNRMKREAFPRAQLWSWKHHHDNVANNATDARNMSSYSNSAKDDVIEHMLRECAPATPTLNSSNNSNSSIAMASNTPGQRTRRVHLHRQLSSTPPASAAAATQQQQHAFRGSRRRLHKKDSAQSIVHDSLSPSSSSSLTTAAMQNLGGGPTAAAAAATTTTTATAARGDGWRTFKLAQRTNRLIEKTRHAVELLALERDANDATDDMNVTSDVLPHVPAAVDPLAAQRIAIAQFTREVLDDSGDDDGDDSSDRDKRQATRSRRQHVAPCDPHRAALQTMLPMLDDLTKPQRWYDNHTNTLRFDNYYVGDARAAALGQALTQLPMRVTHVSMKNVGLTGRGSSMSSSSSGAAALLDRVVTHHYDVLEALDVSDNRIGTCALRQLVKSLDDPRVSLRVLNLGNNQLGDQNIQLLLQCLVTRCTLETLDLRGNQICSAAKALGELVRSAKSLTTLHLAWNNIRGDAAVHFAQCLRENATLTTLDLSDNALGSSYCPSNSLVPAAATADVELGLSLATNCALRYLDVSNNHIHAKAVLVFVHALQQQQQQQQLQASGSKGLATLVLRHNPIGCLGTEAILRAVATNAISPCAIDMRGCNVKSHESQQAPSLLYTGGVFTLVLSDCADAILLRELLQLCWTNKLEITDARLLYNASPVTFNRKDERSFFSSAPTSGTLQLTLEPNADRQDDAIASSGFASLLHLLSLLDSDASLLACLRLLADAFAFSVAQVNALLELFPHHTAQVERATAAAAMIPQILQSTERDSDRHTIVDCASMALPPTFFDDKDGDGQIDVCGDICMVLGLTTLSDVEQHLVEHKVGKWIAFQPLNATGHYTLHMASAIDRRILLRLLAISKHEQRDRTQRKLLDVSQCGAQQQPLQGGFRNVRLNRRAVVMDLRWQVPRNASDVLAFDFVATRRPPRDATALHDAAFEQFLSEFKALDASDNAVERDLQLVGLRALSTRLWFTSAQVQRVMETYDTFARMPATGALYRTEVLVTLFSRIVDEANVCDALALLDVDSKKHVLARLGVLNCFHPLQQSETYDDVALDACDVRQLVVLLVQLAVAGEATLTDVVLNTETVVAPDVWRSWTSDGALPVSGSVSLVMHAVMPTTVSIGSSAGMTEAQLPATSVRKKLLQTLLLKSVSYTQDLVLQ